jgi:predicted amidohydrolase YtcJ
MLAALWQSCAPQAEPADPVLTNGRILTVDPDIPKAEALAVRGETVLEKGRADDIERYVGETTRVIDLQGRLAIPGFIDAHAHFTGIGQAKLGLDLAKASNWNEIRRVGRWPLLTGGPISFIRDRIQGTPSSPMLWLKGNP